MSIQTKKFVRKPFSVEAVEVTEENMTEVAQWCSGQLCKSAGKNGKGVQSYIKVDVKRPLVPRQTQAYAGDWVVTASDEKVKGFKVYTPRAFAESYDAVVEHMYETLERMGERAAEEEKVEQEETLFPEELRYSNLAR